MTTTEPTERQLQDMAEENLTSSFDMVNLLKYRDIARYEQAGDNVKGLSGREAYNEYG